MSRLHLTPEQINSLDMETLEELRDLLNNELCILAEVEKSIYKRRRDLEVEKDPSLLKDKFTPLVQKKNPLTEEELLNLIKNSGITKEALKQFI